MVALVCRQVEQDFTALGSCREPPGIEVFSNASGSWGCGAVCGDC